ncbi:DUF2066 domain-containing protein [Paraglaciecola hydrolytica]|uniref:DUF2066 domain-containing protein n=1 Tax=Paraglaciecola hydrolytica TaxID=1799789 RepID=A0A136A101_9ALTE|nr:DUF2066 domain-containing protein [Paraglaciecola hydrolytica]KXI28916.1 hypothetical protein AX660_12060 [Paraglaciecola hydrolytica]
MSSFKCSWLIVMSFVLLALISNRVSAAIIEDLYDAKVAVVDQSEASQNAAIKQGLKQVFVKVSGSQDLLKHTHITKSLTKASTLIRLYTYEKVQNQLYMVVNFDQEKVQNAIMTAGFPVWDKRRPETILWLAIEPMQQDKQLLNQETQPDLVKRMREQAQKRGIKVVLPVWDLNDVQAVDVYDIWGGFIQQMLLASERYDINSALSARIYRAPSDGTQVEPGKRWLADWTLIDNGQVNSGQLQMSEPEQIVDAIIDALATQLAEKYAISQQNRLLNAVKTQITINNVDSIARYSAIMKFLNGLTVVANATLLEQQGTRATFELDLLGNNDDLLNSFRLDNRMQPRATRLGESSAEMEFMWLN